MAVRRLRTKLTTSLACHHCATVHRHAWPSVHSLLKRVMASDAVQDDVRVWTLTVVDVQSDRESNPVADEVVALNRERFGTVGVGQHESDFEFLGAPTSKRPGRVEQ